MTAGIDSRLGDSNDPTGLFHFFMDSVLAATAAEFLELQPLGRRLAVLRGRIIPLFAITAL